MKTFLIIILCYAMPLAALTIDPIDQQIPPTKAKRIPDNQLRAPDQAATFINLGTPPAIADAIKKPRKHTYNSHSLRIEQTGFARTIPTEEVYLNWQTYPQGGHTAIIIIQSEQALGLRLGLKIQQLPDTAELRFFSPENTDESYVVKGHIINAMIQRNRQTDQSEQADIYWSPRIDGAQIGLELFVPADIEPDDIILSFPMLSHQFADESHPLLINSLRSSSFCHLDYTCYRDSWDAGKAVAHMSFMDGGESYLCTGSLLNNSALDKTAYFLTARHCISSQTVASSLITTWFYRSQSCNSSIENSALVRLVNGATLLHSDTNTDVTLLELNDTPPNGAVFAGWTDEAVGLNENGTGIHHPAGDLKKISFGAVEGYLDCLVGTTNTECFITTSSSFSHMNVGWTSGITEGGSSGSGLFLDSGHLVGTLTSGSSSCNTTTGTDQYGSFRTVFTQALHEWLNPANETAPQTPSDVNTSPTRNRYKNTINYALLQIGTAADHDISASYEVLAGTGKAGIDYVDTSGTVTIEAGQLSTVIPVEIIASDTTGFRTFYIRVFDPVGADFPSGISELKVLRTIQPAI